MTYSLVHCSYMKDYCEKFNIKATYNTTFDKISRKTNTDGVTEFVLKTSRGTYKSKVLIMATGAMKEKLPNIPGIELAKQYSEHSINQEEYENKKVSIIGGGNSAFETADHLSGHAAIVHMHADQGFKLAWDTHFPGDLRAINNSIIDMFHLKSIHGLRKATPTRIEEVTVDGKRQLRCTSTRTFPTGSPHAPLISTTLTMRSSSALDGTTSCRTCGMTTASLVSNSQNSLSLHCKDKKINLRNHPLWQVPCPEGHT